ncbi:MAG: hypothetical protein HOJ00_04680, partial [Phycisphaerae bacterium]|nr:hypothetical protein [Phycisphaerae bacterium]
ADNDVELDDFHGYFDTVGFRGCFGSTVSADDLCAIHDVDQDGDIDLDDFDIFLLAFDAVPADCDDNGVADMLDILLGEADSNNDGILDSCQLCVGDLDNNNSVAVSDLLLLINVWGPCTNCDADFNSDGAVDVLDLLYIVGNWGPCQL